MTEPESAHIIRIPKARIVRLSKNQVVFEPLRQMDSDEFRTFMHLPANHALLETNEK